MIPANVFTTKYFNQKLYVANKNCATTPIIQTHVDAEESSHPMKIIGVVCHSQHLGYNSVLSPLMSKLLHQLH